MIHDLESPLPDEITNQVIRETFFPSELDSNSRRVPDYAKMHRELAKPGVKTRIESYRKKEGEPNRNPRIT